MRLVTNEVNEHEAISVMIRATPSSPIIPQQPRAIATRARVLEIVETIVARDGADHVTTTRVAAEAGTAVGTIYRYFEDRNAMLLDAYDAIVLRLVSCCQAALDELPASMPIAQAASELLNIYLEASEKLPAHAALLAEMRRIRPFENGHPRESTELAETVISPFLQRFAPGSENSAIRLRIIGTILVTMVDLYLVTSDPLERATVRTELEAHLQLMLCRLK